MAKNERSLEEMLFEEGYVFREFFPAVRLLERLQPERNPVGLGKDPSTEVVRFHGLVSLSPRSAIHQVLRPRPEFPQPAMIVTFMSLFGEPSALPRHYTELLMELERDRKGEERYALRDWLDLFNHRFISLFYRAWKKYRFYLPFERKEFAKPIPDPFTLALFSFIGLGTQGLRNRLKIFGPPALKQAPPKRPLARIDDLVLLRYSGFFAHRPRNAASLQAMLGSYLRLPVEVIQFHGQWLRLEPTNCTALGGMNQVGQNVIVGDRIWDVQSKIRIRLGPLSYQKFQEFLPDPGPTPERKQLFLLAKLVRLYVGPEFDVEFQLVLRKDEVPACKLGARGAALGGQLGWNTWSKRKPKERDADEAVFPAQEWLLPARQGEATEV